MIIQGKDSGAFDEFKKEIKGRIITWRQQIILM